MTSDRPQLLISPKAMKYIFLPFLESKSVKPKEIDAFFTFCQTGEINPNNTKLQNFFYYLAIEEEYYGTSPISETKWFDNFFNDVSKFRKKYLVLPKK
jgi:hypothetical protein